MEKDILGRSKKGYQPFCLTRNGSLEIYPTLTYTLGGQVSFAKSKFGLPTCGQGPTQNVEGNHVDNSLRPTRPS